MSEENTPGKFLLYLDMGEALDQDQLDQLTRQLQNELLDQDIENADLVRGDELPEGAKAADVITWGALAIEVLPKFLPGIVEFLKSWVMREESRNVKIKTQVGDKSIEIDYSSKGIKDEEVKDLVSILAASLEQKEVVAGEEELAKSIPAEVEISQSLDEMNADTAENTKAEDQIEEKIEPPPDEDVVEAKPNSINQPEDGMEDDG